jgi:hypothetical protein
VKYYFRIFFFALLCSLVVAACKNKTVNDHLPPKVMQKVLLDISFAETYSTMVRDSLHKAGSKNYDSLSVYYKEVLGHHNITQDQLTQSFAWYKNHPDELDSVYAAILPMVTRMQSKNGIKQ